MPTTLSAFVADRAAPLPKVADMLRTWRQHRRYSQLGLALDVGISARHLSFLENGRANASRELLVRLANRLELPPRERNALLLAAGYAPQFPERPISDPSFADVRAAMATLLRAMEPSPALIVDRHWSMIDANRIVPRLLDGVAAELLTPPMNVLRLALHPRGIAPRIENLAEWKQHLLARLSREVRATADPRLRELSEELRAYGPEVSEDADSPGGSLVVPLRLRSAAGVLSFLSTTTVFGTAADVTVAELAIESFLPADEFTAAALRALIS